MSDEFWRDDEFWHGVSPEGVPIHRVSDEELARTTEDLVLRGLDFEHEPSPEELAAREERARQVDAWLDDPEYLADYENRAERERFRADLGLADPHSLEHMQAGTGAFAPPEEPDADEQPEGDEQRDDDEEDEPEGDS